MRMALAASPYVTFGFLTMAAPMPIAILVALAMLLALVVDDAIHHRSAKILQLGAIAIFVVLGAAMTLCGVALEPSSIRACIDAGLLAIGIASLAAGTPFTLQYAREHVDAVTAARPLFFRINVILTAIWSAAFALMLIAELLTQWMPLMPLGTAAAIAFVARNGAMLFTRWYPGYRSARHSSDALPV